MKLLISFFLVHLVSLQAMENQEYIRKFAQHTLVSAQMTKNTEHIVTWQGTFAVGCVEVSLKDDNAYVGHLNGLILEKEECKYWLNRLVFKAKNLQ